METRVGEGAVDAAVLRGRLRDYYARYYRDTLGLPGWLERATRRLDEHEFGAEQLRGIERLVGTFDGRRLLNVGCGTGGFNTAAELAGAWTCGIDASQEAVTICEMRRALGAGGRYATAVAEALPFTDGAFDVVICLSTLEHVADVASSLQEMVRVLRPGGALFVYAPSGWACYESHYKLPWIPWCPRPLARVYLRLLGRPTAFAATLNALGARRCRRVLEAAGAHVEEPDLDSASAGNMLVRAYYRALRVKPLRVKPYIALRALKTGP